MHEMAFLPCGHHGLTNVLYDLRLEIVRKVAVTNAVTARRIGGLLVIVLDGIEHECTHEFVGRMATRIAVECHTHVNRYIKSWTLWIGGTTACQVVHPTSATTEVIGIVVLATRVVIDTVGDTCILQPIACAFNLAWITTGSGMDLTSNM